MSRHDRELLVDGLRRLFLQYCQKNSQSSHPQYEQDVQRAKCRTSNNHSIKCDRIVTHFYVWPMSLGVTLSIEGDDGTSAVMYRVQET